MKNSIILMAAVLLTLFGCRKDKEDTIDRETLLTQGSWKITALTVDPAIDWFGTMVTNVYSQMPSCVKDNLTVFNKNGTTNYDEGPSKCDPNEPQTTSGTWAFNTDKSILSLTTEGETESWNLSTLNDQKIEAEYQITEDGITYTFSITLNKN